MSAAFYSHARLYDLMFPDGGPAVDFYRAAASRQGGRVLELGCGTGHKLIPIASDGHPFIAANSLLHLHEAEDLVSCFRSVRRHLAPGARFVASASPRD